ncbi:N-acetylmuramoyl-L-alanine amidase [Actinobacillus minor]|uniref:N-acetylmuramoyl-L-alanine amidase n=1 Tax=Actinobacillus minor TaxID=51047 RepID=UPI0026E92D26|nr:N-acetylmuramoyl-L-alanine amidase [Actinobacillus minor]
MKKVIHYFLVSLFGLMLSSLSQARTVVVIDAGHGGKDPGAIGKTLGIKEKEVTLSISKELKALLDADPNFKAVMTRNSDTFIQLPERTEIARKNKANYLVSIHADSSPISSEIKGASVWVLSNQRASDEMGKWLEESEKQSELLGGAGRILSNNNERYLNQTVLDLQFSHSQRAGYELGKTVLARMANMTTLAKSAPQHASLSVLRSPDITSILVETGFLSNPVEEKKLSTASYRKQLARAIYNGLVAYRNSHVNISESRTSNVKVKEVKESKKDKDKKEDTSKDTPKKPVKEVSTKEKKSTKAENSKDIERKSKEKDEVKKEEKSERKQPQKSNTGYHLVQQDETLYSIARVYGTTPEKLSQLNNIKNNQIVVGKKLKVQ